MGCRSGRKQIFNFPWTIKLLGHERHFCVLLGKCDLLYAGVIVVLGK